MRLGVHDHMEVWKYCKGILNTSVIGREFHVYTRGGREIVRVTGARPVHYVVIDVMDGDFMYTRAGDGKLCE